MARSRAFAGEADLERMEALVQDACASLGPRFECVVGDLAWRMWRATTVRPTDDIQLWEDDAGVLIGFAWFITNGDLELIVFPRTWCAAIAPEMLAWGRRRADQAAVGRLVAWALHSNRPLTAALVGADCRPTGGRYVHFAHSLDAEIPTPTLPTGFAVRAVGADAAAERAALHRAAFPHSAISAGGYRRLMASRHYRAELDLVVVAPDGALVAAALAWFDGRNRVGAFEPTGTDPAFRRRGLVSAAIQEGLRRLRALGAAQAIVYAAADDAASVALYRRLGFAPIDENCGYTLSAHAARHADLS
jgi:ribosomal protein S18 acetylase RimI-like enzyme